MKNLSHTWHSFETLIWEFLVKAGLSFSQKGKLSQDCLYIKFRGMLGIGIEL